MTQASNSLRYPSSPYYQNVSLTVQTVMRAVEGVGQFQSVQPWVHTFVFPNGAADSVPWPVLVNKIVDTWEQNNFQEVYKPRGGFTALELLRRALLDRGFPAWNGGADAYIYVCIDGPHGGLTVG